MIAKVVVQQGVSFPIPEKLAIVLSKLETFSEGRFHHKRDQHGPRGWRRGDASLLAQSLKVGFPAEGDDGPGSLDVLIFTMGEITYETPCNRTRAEKAVADEKLQVAAKHSKRGFWLVPA